GNKDRKLRSSCSASGYHPPFPSWLRHAVSRAGQSRLAANTTTRRQEVDESWTDFNLQLIITLQEWLTGKVAPFSALADLQRFRAKWTPVRVKKRVKQEVWRANLEIPA